MSELAEFERILEQASRDLRMEGSLEALQCLCVGVYCCDQNRRWRSASISRSLARMYARAVKSQLDGKIRHKVKMQMEPEAIYELNNVYDCYGVRCLTEAVVSTLKQKTKVKIDPQLVGNRLEPFVVQSAALAFCFFYSSQADRSVAKAVDVFLTQNEELVRHADLWFVEFKRRLSASNRRLSKELLQSKDRGEGSFDDLVGFLE